MPKNPDSETKAILSQRERFEEAARALGCDESEERFDAALKKIARHKTRPTTVGQQKHELQNLRDKAGSENKG